MDRRLFLTFLLAISAAAQQESAVVNFSAQTKLVGTLYQYNSAKLQLARNTGVVETQYKVYLGR